MRFNTFCNICFIKENIIKLCCEENEPLLNILISFTSCRDIVTDIIYLCINCCNKLEEYDKFRELFLTNFVRFRYLYSEHKKQLEISNAPDIETQLKAFVDVNVKRASGTPLIENYEVTQALRSNTTCNVDITCKEADGQLYEVELQNLIHKDESMHTHTSFNSENTTTGNETQDSHVKYEQDSVKKDLENINGSSIYVKGEPYLFDEVSHEITDTDIVATSIPYLSSVYNENCNLSSDQKIFKKVDASLEEDEPNPDRFEESHDHFVSDTVAVIPCRALEGDDNCDLLSNPENCGTDNIADEEGATDEATKEMKSDTICNVCGKRFPCNSVLKRHIRTHTGEKPYHCDECGKTFANNSYLTLHKRTHSGEKPYKCDECGSRYANPSTLSNHKRIHTGERPYSCDECQKTFTEISTLKNHKRTHSGEKPYKCDECSLAFSQRSSLNKHKRTHTGEKPYECDVCHKLFIQSFNLTNHKRIHSGEKPYKCDECGMNFVQRSQLNTHKRKHTSDRPYSCDDCQKRFKDNSSLLIHKRIHSGEKPHKCEECGLGFTQLSTLGKHKRTHTGEKPYKCDECHTLFKQSSNLIRHKRSHCVKTP